MYGLWDRDLIAELSKSLLARTVPPNWSCSMPAPYHYNHRRQKQMTPDAVLRISRLRA